MKTKKGLHIIRAMYGEFRHPGNVVPVRRKVSWLERARRAIQEAMR